MSEEEIVNKFLNMIATNYGGSLATQFKNQYILKDKEIERLKADYSQANDIIVEQSKEIERLKERLDISQIAYLSLDKKINKAIEYIEENSYQVIEKDKDTQIEWLKLRLDKCVDLLDILEGDDKK